MSRVGRLTWIGRRISAGGFQAVTAVSSEALSHVVAGHSAKQTPDAAGGASANAGATPSKQGSAGKAGAGKAASSPGSPIALMSLVDGISRNLPVDTLPQPSRSASLLVLGVIQPSDKAAWDELGKEIVHAAPHTLIFVVEGYSRC